MKKLITLIPLFVILVGCGTIHVDPAKMPKNPIYCSANYQCPRGYYCGFPAIDTYACCLPK